MKNDVYYCKVSNAFFQTSLRPCLKSLNLFLFLSHFICVTILRGFYVVYAVKKIQFWNETVSMTFTHQQLHNIKSHNALYCVLQMHEILSEIIIKFMLGKTERSHKMNGHNSFIKRDHTKQPVVGHFIEAKDSPMDFWFIRLVQINLRCKGSNINFLRKRRAKEKNGHFGFTT